MARTSLLFLLFAAALTSHPNRPTWAQANQFGSAYDKWAALRNTRVSDIKTVDTVSMPEIMAWLEVEKEFKTLRTQVKEEYGAKWK